MTVSNSVDYNQIATDIIVAAFQDVGVTGPGETPNAGLMKVGLDTCNRMIKAWQGEGLFLWKNTDIAVFMGYGEYSFDIGPTGDHATASYVKTEIATAASSGDGTITVDDDEGMTTGDYIGIELDDGTLQWTTINGAPVANVVTLTAVLTDDVAVDNHVYTYTTKANRPLEIIDARLHYADDRETDLMIKTRQEYKSIAQKTSVGVPNLIYYDPQRTNGKLNVWNANGDVQNYIIMTIKDPIMDLDSVSNDFDFPQEWYEALEFNLAVRLCPKVGRSLTPELQALAFLSKTTAEGFDTEHGSVFFEIY